MREVLLYKRCKILLSAIQVAHGIKPPNSSTWLYKWIWNINAMPKIKCSRNNFAQSLTCEGHFVKKGNDYQPTLPHLFRRYRIHRASIQRFLVKKVWELGVAHHWSPPIFSPLGCYDFSQCMDKVQSSQNPKLKKKTFISPMEHLEAYKFNSFQK